MSEREQRRVLRAPRAFVEAVAFLSPYNIPPNDTPRITDYFEIGDEGTNLVRG